MHLPDCQEDNPRPALFPVQRTPDDSNTPRLEPKVQFTRRLRENHNKNKGKQQGKPLYLHQGSWYYLNTQPFSLIKNRRQETALQATKTFQKLEKAYEAYRNEGRLPASYEVVYLRAIKPKLEESAIPLSIK